MYIIKYNLIVLFLLEINEFVDRRSDILLKSALSFSSII